MEKWIVDNKPRMALFAGESGVETGEELTYDYNFKYECHDFLYPLGYTDSLSPIVGSRALASKSAAVVPPSAAVPWASAVTAASPQPN